MASRYKILRTVSSKGNKAQITVTFDKRTVTRHIIDGLGRHPDDSLPVRHNHLALVVRDLQEDVRKIDKAQVAIQHEIDTNGQEVETARIAFPIYVLKRALADAALLEASDRYAAVLAEDPLIVTYVQEDPDAPVS